LLYVGYTTKYLKRDVHPLMPTKLKGMTSIEVAIIVAIVLVIAVAVGWYLYTTFIAAATSHPNLNVVSAEISSSSRQLRLLIVNPGPADVQIVSAEIAGQTVTLSCQAGTTRTNVVKVGGNVTCTGAVPSGITLTPGTMLTGRVIVGGGQSFPFTAAVRP
jgi:type IV pilus assembly protein PilA